NIGADDIFLADLANGNYIVTVTLGDAAFTHTLMKVVANGTQVLSGLTTGTGQFIVRSFPVTVNSGQLALELTSTGGAAPTFAINGLTIRQAPVGAIAWSGPSQITADGSSTATFTGTTTVPPGSLITVATTLGTITTADANPNYAGIQVAVGSD